MLHHARERSLTPVACVLAGGDATGVRLRNLGMNTEAAPTSVQLAQFEVVLVCEDGSGAVHPLPLDGLGVAAAISLAAGAPIRMPAATWEARSSMRGQARRSSPSLMMRRPPPVRSTVAARRRRIDVGSASTARATLSSSSERSPREWTPHRHLAV